MHVSLLRQQAEDRGERGGGGLRVNILAEHMHVASSYGLKHWSFGNAVEEAQLLAGGRVWTRHGDADSLQVLISQPA